MLYRLERTAAICPDGDRRRIWRRRRHRPRRYGLYGMRRAVPHLCINGFPLCRGIARRRCRMNRSRGLYPRGCTLPTARLRDTTGASRTHRTHRRPLRRPPRAPVSPDRPRRCPLRQHPPWQQITAVERAIPPRSGSARTSQRRSLCLIYAKAMPRSSRTGGTSLARRYGPSVWVSIRKERPAGLRRSPGQRAHHHEPSCGKARQICCVT